MRVLETAHSTRPLRRRTGRNFSVTRRQNLSHFGAAPPVKGGNRIAKNRSLAQ